MDPLIGTRINNFVIRAALGKGGMADVYLADDTLLNRQVVIKIILPRLAADETFVTRFQREGLATAQIDHPNIVQIYSTGRLEDGRPFLVMRYVPGGSLADKLRRMSERSEHFGVTSALEMARQIADALIAAHRAGIVHRDLKPSNILLDSQDSPIVTDLGIAHFAGGARLTQTGHVMGTPHYMSPEQASGQAPDGRSDIYALGVILHELLAGATPFGGDSPMAILHQQIYEPPPPLLSLRPGLHPETYAVVEKALQKAPEFRFQTASAMHAALEHALAAERGLTSTEPQIAGAFYPPPPPPTELLSPSSAQPHRSRVWLLALPVLLLLAIGLFWLWQRDFRFSSELEPTAAGAVIVETATPMPTQTAVSSTATSAPTVTRAPTSTPLPSPAPTLPPRDPQIVFQSNRDGDFEIYIMNPDGGNQRQLTVNTSDDNYPVVSPDGSEILFQSERDGNQEVYVMNLDGSNQRRLTFEPADDRLPTWSPDGRQIAFISRRSGNNNIHTMNADGSEVRQLTNDAEFSGHPSWSVNNEIVFSSGEHNGNTWEIYVMDVDGRNQRQLTSNIVSDWSPEWSPDGRSILYLHSISKSDEAAIYIMNADGGNQRLLFTSDDYEWGADWSPDGRKIVFTRENGAASYIYSMNADGSDVTFITERGSYPSWAQ